MIPDDPGSLTPSFVPWRASVARWGQGWLGVTCTAAMNYLETSIHLFNYRSTRMYIISIKCYNVTHIINHICDIFSLLSESITAARRLVTENWHRWTLAWRSSWGEGEKLKRLRLENCIWNHQKHIFVYKYIDLFPTEATINHWYLLTVTPSTLNSLDSTTFCEGWI